MTKMKFKNVYSLILLLAIFAQQNSSVGESRSIRNVLTKIHQEEERLVNGSSKDLLPILALKNFNIPKLCDWKSPNLGRNSTYGRYNPKYCLTPGIMPIYHFLVDFLRFQQIDQMTIIIDIDGQNFDGLRAAIKYFSFHLVEAQVIWSKDMRTIQEFQFSKMNVLLTDPIKLENLLSLISKNPDPDTHWLINSQNPQRDLKDQYCAFDSNIFTYYFKDDVAFVHEAFRVKRSMSMNLNSVGVWSPQIGLVMTKLDKWDRRTDLEGLVFTAAATINAPYIDFEYTNDPNEPLKLWGITYDMWKYLELAMNFSSKVIPSTDGKWGAKTDNGSFDGIIGMIQRQEVDAGIGDLGLSKERAEVADFIGTVGELDNGLYYRDAILLDPYTFIAPLSANTWFAFGCSILLCSICYFIVTHFGDPSDKRYGFDYLLSLMIIMHGVSNQGAPIEPTKIPGRVIFILVYLTGLVIIALYSAALTSILAIKVQHLPFTNEETLLYNSPYSIITVAGTVQVDAFQFGNDIQKAIYKNRLVQAEDINAALIELEKTPNLALLWSGVSLDAVFNGACDYRLIPNFAYANQYVFYLQKGTPYRGLFNKHVQIMKESGKMEKLGRKWLSRRNTGECDTPHIESLGIDKVFTSFVFMLFGILLAGLLYLLEVVYKNNSRSKRRRKPENPKITFSYDLPRPSPYKHKQSLLMPLKFQKSSFRNFS